MITFHQDYFDDPKALAAFEAYALQIHGLDFGLWKEKGLWDPNYIAFSAFDGDTCVASVCVYPSAMRIGGHERTGAQLLTVGTLPEYRRKGIQRTLWKKAKLWIEERFAFTFLFTDDDAAGFYKKLGFHRLVEHSELITISGQSAEQTSRGLKLDFDREDHYELVRRLASEREMVSHRVGFDNSNLLLFMYLYGYRDSTYYLGDLDAIVVVSDAEDRLIVHDVMAVQMPALTELIPFFSGFGRNEIEFRFSTDRLDAPTPRFREIEDSLLFIYGNFELEGNILFPDSIRA